MSPLPTPDERARIAALRKYGFVEGESHAEFDDLARIAAKIAEAPIAAVTMVDADRQIFVGSCGLDVSGTPREESFCAYAILQPAVPLEVNDATADDRFRTNPMVTGEAGIRFYYGAPILDEEGFPLGSLCVVDVRPRTLSEPQRMLLGSLAQAAAAQIRLIARNRQLEETTDELAIARDRAMMAFVTKQRFLTSVSHEVRTPLNGIIGVAGLLRSTGLTVEGEHFLDMILNAAESLATMCDGVLADAQSETEELMPVESAPLADVVAEAVALHRPVYALRGGMLDFTPPGPAEETPYVWDAASLRRALGNLLRDVTPGATAPKTTVTMETLAEDDRHAEVKVSVKVGADGRVPTAFSISSQQSCLAFATRYAGSFGTYCDTTGDLHAWIHARLPLMRRPDEVVSPHPGIFRADVLVVEDHSVNALVLTSMLERLGCRTSLAQNGREAVEVSLNRRFDLILMDIQMPEMDGIEATRKIREGRGANRRTPIVAVTASALDSDRVAASAAGMVDFVTKPVRSITVAAVLERILAEASIFASQ